MVNGKYEWLTRLTWSIGFIREITTVRGTSYVGRPESSTNFPGFKSGQVNMKLHTPIFKHLCEVFVVDFVMVDVPDHNSQVVMSI